MWHYRHFITLKQSGYEILFLFTIMRFKVRNLFSSLFEYPIISDSRYLMRIFVRRTKIIATKIYYNTKCYQNYNRRKFMIEIKCCYNQSSETNQTLDLYIINIPLTNIISAQCLLEIEICFDSLGWYGNSNLQNTIERKRIKPHSRTALMKKYLKIPLTFNTPYV